jgi:hypothetical protein
MCICIYIIFLDLILKAASDHIYRKDQKSLDNWDKVKLILLTVGQIYPRVEAG